MRLGRGTFALVAVAVVGCAAPRPADPPELHVAPAEPRTRGVAAEVEAILAAATEPEEAPEEENAWSFSVYAYSYFVPDDRDYLSGIATADRGHLHLEARWNYEGIDSGSLFAGWNFEWGEELTFALTPIVGGVFGDTAGVAPGYEATLSWKGFELYTEGEYLFDTRDSSGNFFYSWSELTYSPKEWVRGGIVIQRTKAYETDLDVQRGLLLGFSWRRMTLTGYLFNLGWDDPTFVLSLGVDF